jgi:hypothetical protein
MKRRKKPAGEGYAFTFHGSYQTSRWHPVQPCFTARMNRNRPARNVFSLHWMGSQLRLPIKQLGPKLSGLRNSGTGTRTWSWSD